MTKLFFQCSKILLVVSVVVILLARFIATSRGAVSDYLVYSQFGWRVASLKLYDFGRRLSIPIGIAGTTGGFSLNANNHLAYSSNETGNYEIYLLAIHSTTTQAINITQTPATDESPLAWSPDGRYLAFLAYQAESPLLYIWDGKTVANVTPKDTTDPIESYHDVVWSLDGRLAFTVWYGVYASQMSEIYLWDGDMVTNLSQNPIGRDRLPVWSEDGRIAFLSEHNAIYDIYLWDGVSVKDGSPDFDTFTNIAPELTRVMSEPVWNNQGLLSFLGLSQQGTSAQIYVWDGQTATSISQDRLSEGGTPYWSGDGRLAFMPLFQPLLYVYDADKRPLLRVAAQSSPAWSSGGYLMFCTPGLELSIWDGNSIVKIASGEIRASWGNGNGVICSSG